MYALNYHYFHTNCSTFLKIKKTLEKLKKTFGVGPIDQITVMKYTDKSLSTWRRM